MGKRQIKINKEGVADQFRLPKDIFAGAICISIIGNNDIWIENYRGIIEYTNERILLQGKKCKVCFEGNGLTIEYYTNEDMKIIGYITSIRYLT